MKLRPSLPNFLASLGLLTAAVAQDQQPAATPVQFNIPNVATPGATPAAPAAPVVKYTEAQMMEVYGFMMGTRMGLAELGFTAPQIDAMAKGMRMAAQGEQPAYNAQAIGPQLQEFLAAKQKDFMLKLRNQNMAETAAYFTKLKENQAVKELPSGLRYEVLTEGKGTPAKDGQIVRMHYTGAFANGQVFDSSRQPRQEGAAPEPMETVVQNGSLIDGMVEALKLMAPGASWRLHLPPHIAYGDDGMNNIPPAATLVFEVEVLEVKDAPKPAEEAKK